MQFRRDQDVFIMSAVELNCNTPLSIVSKWTIKECSANCLTPIELDQSITTTRSELFIPGKFLMFGMYELELNVSVMFPFNWTSSVATYIQIKPSNIAVNLMLFGTSMISHGYRQSLTLNPGAYSLNPDGIPFNSSVSLLICW